MATFNFRSAGPAGSNWTEKRLKDATGVEPQLDPQKVSHSQFCKQRAAYWLGQLTTTKKEGNIREQDRNKGQRRLQ
ncbi:hypothetical protein OAL34_02785 [Synechococcus sp. AH-551-G03]|nr:hypothetical protein [Synechococcus sp. AH-551-G03]